MRAAILALLAACAPPDAYRCATSSDCGAGQCEADGYCSVADSECASGRRYGEEAGASAGTCVDDGTVIEPGDERVLCGVTAAPPTSGTCAQRVCADEPWCCETSWDAGCARSAEAHCELDCGDELIAAGGFTTAAVFGVETPTQPVWTATYFNFSYQPAWGDFDGDGLPDLAFARHSDATDGVLLMHSAGFTQGALSLTPLAIAGDPIGAVNDLEWRDFDGDGDLDLLAGGSSGVYVIVNAGGAFTAHRVISEPANAIWTSASATPPWRLAVVYDTLPQATVRTVELAADYTLGAMVDLGMTEWGKPAWCQVVGSPARDLLVGRLLYAASGASFATPQALPVGGFYPVCADLDGDGDNDLILGGFGNVTYLPNTGGFAGAAFTLESFIPGGITIGDFDGNGLLDVLLSEDTNRREDVPLVVLDSTDSGLVRRDLPDWNTADWDSKGVAVGRMPLPTAR